MTSTIKHSHRFVTTSSSVLRHGGIISLALSLSLAQSQIVSLAQQNNSNSGKRQHVATLRSSDSQEGSRVAINSDQSLNNYEAYRRGDRFYVKIPAADVPRAEAVRGRGFADVTAQRNGDSTVLSFRLQPGATAHVEQRANKLDVVVTVPGGSPSVTSSRSRESTRPGALEPLNRNSGPKNVAAGSNTSPAQSNLNSNRRAASAATPTLARATPTPAATPAAKGSPTPNAFASASPLNSTIAKTSPTASPVSTTTTQSQPNWWSRMKERGHYWLLLAQLNPIPVAVGAAVLILIIGLLLVQRRRAKATKRVKSVPVEASKPSTELTPETSVAPIVEPVPATAVEVPLKAAVPLAAPVIASETPAPAPVVPIVPVPPVASVVDDGRRERVNQVAAEAKKLFDGADYDAAIIGSEDRDTRRLVGAELLSALVGRNPARRERAREAFMKHGYFDDATRDLRVAESDNERAAAARRLSFVHDREAVPHLIGALGDPAPDVRRASVEALMDLRDPSAISPLNSLLQTENDRKVPRPLIKHAIEACATSAPEATVLPAPESFSHPSPQSIETEREVIEI
jgi:HEAT repeats